MNKRIYTYFAAALAAIGLCACEGTADGGDTGSDGVNDVPEGVLRIFADKTEIVADGNDKVTFTVMYGSQDVSTEKTLQLKREFDGSSRYMAYGANGFTTTTAGTYTFTAEYYYAGKKYSDNSVEIVAAPYFSGEARNYEQRVLGVYFTSTGCTSCPSASNGIRMLQEADPGKISVVAFHSDLGSIADPMTIPETALFNSALGGFDGLPRLFWNMRKGTTLIGPTFTESYQEELAAYEPNCGVAVETSIDEAGRTLDVNVMITSNLPSVYRYIVFLVEDGIVADQTGDADYVHDNVVRSVLTKPTGDKINDNLPLNVGVEAEASETVTIPDGWNVQNMRVVAAALTSEDGGYNWTVNNVNECRAGDSVSYIYSE
ncbi:MAG: Omp28-related outer membrane protein [Bacteroidales bacterium]|nr:Omp28-related outer membrane protein [Bacteroidales bacterium]